MIRLINLWEKLQLGYNIFPISWIYSTR